MRLPDDFKEENVKSSLTPTILSAIVAVTLFVGGILVMVLMMNNRQTGYQTTGGQMAESETETAPAQKYPDTDKLVTGSTLSPSDFDFWDKYPQESQEQETKKDSGEEASKSTEVISENDPSADGKHTLVVNRDGKEEWVLISPYLPKHEYDFSKLVCQSDLMKYYEDGRQISYVGAEISKYQDYVDYVKLKKSGIDYVMIRIGARGYGSGQLVEDESFSDNMKRAVDAGLQAGVYFSSQAITREEAEEEAEFVLEKLKDCKITYPVAFDMGFVENDTARVEKLTKQERTQIAKTFLDAVAAGGYKTVIYGDKEWLIKEIDMSKLTAYDVWLEQCQDVPDYPYRFTMWNYSDTGTVDGIVGYTNLSISFIDYSAK